MRKEENVSRSVQDLPNLGETAAVGYDEAKDIASHDDPAVRGALAAREDLRPEILYFLSEDDAPEVRRAIAANPNTPRQADRNLAQDPDQEVRCEIAAKIGRLAPTLSDIEKDRLQELAIEILEILAHDQLPRVRQVVAGEIKRCDNIPRHLVRTLAQDLELVVSAPILEYSPLLSDEDLLDIIRSGMGSGGLSAISRRSGVATPVSDAIVAANDDDATATLLVNPSAQIREETLDQIIDSAPSREKWHQPLVERPELTVRSVRRIANFVARSLLNIMSERHDLPSEVAAEVRNAVASRFEKAGIEGGFGSAQAAEAAHKEGRLNDDSLIEALDRGDRDFVNVALALMTGVEERYVRKIFASNSAKAVTGLAWAAGLTMRTSIQLQIRIAKLPTEELLQAKEGVDYPLDEEELRWQFELSCA